MRCIAVWCCLLLLASGRGFAQQSNAGANGLPDVIPTDYHALMAAVHADSGRIVLLNAWASWCLPCREEMPSLLRLLRAHQDSGFALVLIAIDDIDSLQRVIRPLLKQMGVTFPSYILRGTSDDDFITAMDSSWTGALPATFVYDRLGRQVGLLVGGKSYEQVDRVIKPLLKRRPQ